MNILLFFVIFNTCFGYHKPYHHPNYRELHGELSKQLREETHHNFITLTNAKYASRITREHLSNQSIYRKNKLQERKMKYQRKTDYLFARYQMMVQRVQLQTEKNLLQLERIRSFTSNHLSLLKTEHLEMIDQLTLNDQKINELMKEKKETHLDEMLEKYTVWKSNHEGAEEIINSL